MDHCGRQIHQLQPNVCKGNIFKRYSNKLGMMEILK